MNKLKLKLYIISTFSFLFIPFKEVNSLLGYTHVVLGNAYLDSTETEISDNNRNAFLSGEVFADIGRMKYDKIMLKKHGKKIDSDSEDFIKEMQKHISNEEEKWFVRGCMLHFIQDKHTDKFLKNLFNTDKVGYLHYGMADNCFREKNKTYIYSDLDKETFLNMVDVNEISDLIQSVLDKKSEFGNLENALKLFVKMPGVFQNLTVKLKLCNYFDENNLTKLTIRPQYKLLQKTYKSLGIEVGDINDDKYTLEDDIKKEAVNLITVSILITMCSENKAQNENFKDNVEACIKNITQQSIDYLTKNKLFDI